MCAFLALTAPLAAMAQQTVFYDNFANGSTLNGVNSSPGGMPTASSTSYTIASAKTATSTAVAAGHFSLITGSTSSGNSEAQALFTKYPVTLASVGDYIEITYTFTDTFPLLQSTNSASGALFMGLYNSGGVAPLGGTVLWSGGFNSSLTTADTGGTVGWLGYAGQIYNGESWNLLTRPAQTAVVNNLNQGLLYNYSSGVTHSASNPGSPNLVPGQQYTCQLRITLSDVGTLTISNGLYFGADTSAPLYYSNVWTGVTGANLLTTNFDSLAVGYRAGTPAAWTNDINSITVVASLAAQAGPYYSVTSSGDPCAGGLTIGLSGSVTTNAYLLYINGADSGQSPVLGTGSAISLGFQTTPGTYTVVASNTVTASEGPMYGSATIAASGAPVITQEPASVSVVTNVTASFTVAATGTLLTYQWYKNGVALTNGGDISGAQTTNLVISPTQAADAATSADGYYVVVQDPCGHMTTSTPVASLTLTAPLNLTWAGGNTDDNWEYSELNFTLSGTPTAFSDGDNVTFDNTSGNKTVTITNSLVPTSVTVTGNTYDFNGAGKLTGFGALVVDNAGSLAIANNDDYTGGTTVTNGSTLSLGDGTSVNGSVKGTVTVTTNSILNYNTSAGSANVTININNALAGSGTVNFYDAAGATFATALAAISSNFNGTINIQGYTALHASNGNAGDALGNGSTINVPDNTQVWLDSSATPYNNTFNIGGTGWIGATPNTGAMRVYDNTINGPINLMDNARIGGTINGATIQSVISGPYQLEVWGTTNSFVLVMGPTNGSPQAYASTLITAGAISAANSNAISSGPLTLDSGGDMQVNGNNITVASLSSINSGNVLLIEGPRVRNMNGTTNGTLTVGTDGTSTEFDGTFSDGAAASFGLTKVGAGTLTLTGVNTSSGTIAVQGGTLAMSSSGSFNNAATIAVGSGATYDVTGTGNPLTLNSGQTLTGSGTVKGSVSASAGSVINPGDSIGTLTITGDATLAGGLTMELNRTNSPAMNDSLVVSGTLTAGGTLTVNNLGPALQVGDTFHLFSGPITGFSAINLPATDGNGYGYTWTNKIGLDGSIQVLTAAPAIANFYFRSVTSGNWSDTSTWQQSTNGVNWVAAAGTPDYTATNIVIQTGTTVTNLLAVTVDHMTVQTNATVLLTTGNLTITNSTAAVDCLVGGTLNVGAGSGVINNSGSLVFTNGGAFVWNRAAIPTIPTATWQNGSSCIVSNMATGLVTGISGQSFYDFIWDTTVAGQSSRGRLNITGTTTVIRRDFTVTIPNTSGASMTINNDPNGILTVGRNVSLNGGLASNGIKILLANAAAETNLFKVGGNFTATGYIDGFGGALTTFDFNGAGTQSTTFPSSTFILTPGAMNWQVEAGSTVALASSIQAFNDFTNNGTLTFGTYMITNGTALALNSTGTVNGNGTNILVSGITSIINGGTLNLTNSTSLPAFAGGESFTLFSAGSYSGTFGTLLPATPDSTHTWVTTQLNTAGILAVGGGVNTNPTNIVTRVNGLNLELSWPADHTGWTLQAQTNSLSTGLGTNWVNVAGSTSVDSVTNGINPANGSVFYRLIYNP
jgi:autotransporter-associated beta strand protein